MSVLSVFGVAALAVAVLWTGQSVALKLAGEPLAWPLRYATRKPLIRWTGRVMIHLSWLIILVGSPLALGVNPLDALARAFPLPVPWRDIAVAFAVVFIPYWAMLALLVRTCLVAIEPQGDPAKRRGKVLRRFLGPLPLATLEEGVFRGILLEQLLVELPGSTAGTALAIVVSAAVFSAVHFIKRSYPGKPVLQPAYGLFIVGCLLGLAYVLGGRSLWLPIAIHATAVFDIEVSRLYVVYRGPRWLMGHPEWPQAGLLGSLYVLGVGLALVLLI